MSIRKIIEEVEKEVVWDFSGSNTEDIRKALTLYDELEKLGSEFNFVDSELTDELYRELNRRERRTERDFVVPRTRNS